MLSLVTHNTWDRAETHQAGEVLRYLLIGQGVSFIHSIVAEQYQNAVKRYLAKINLCMGGEVIFVPTNRINHTLTSTTVPATP
jgi:hypothetical protein